jgi:hypothetical protein
MTHDDGDEVLLPRDEVVLVATVVDEGRGLFVEGDGGGGGIQPLSPP